jgi:hypothetical protein
LEISTLRHLRERALSSTGVAGRLSLRQVVADVRDLHSDGANADALFQVASQFNLLEMVSPRVSPELGVGIYERDRTQGPACAIAAGAGTIFRNYFVDLNGQIGQSADRQINCLSGIGHLFGNHNGALWVMQNGYALPSQEGLSTVNSRLCAMSENHLDCMRDALEVGIQWGTEVTIGQSNHLVSQVYCSALPIAYTDLATDLWERFARLILEAAYEATVCAGIINASKKQNRTLFLTLLGGGAFGNPEVWIFDAILRALSLYEAHGLDVVLVSYGAPHPCATDLVESWNRRQGCF